MLARIVRASSIELAWLAGSYVLALGVTRALLGVPPLDVQMHNTYFVLSTPYAAVPLSALLAAVITAVRLVSHRLRTPCTKIVLIGLALVGLLIGALVVFWATNGLRSAHGR